MDTVQLHLQTVDFTLARSRANALDRAKVMILNALETYDNFS